MENKITINSLAGNLAATTGKTKKLCEDFLKEFFKVAAEVLDTEETLKIKGFGTFKTIDVESRESINVNTGKKQEIASFKKVVFTPAKELASAINAPFEDFNSVEIDDVPEDIFYENTDGTETGNLSIPEESSIDNENKVSDDRLEEGSEEENSDDVITYEAYTEQEPEEDKKETSEAFRAASTNEVDDYDRQQINVAGSLPVYEYEEPVKSRFGIGFLIGSLSTFAVCAVIFMLGCFFDWWPVNFGNIKNIARVETVAPSPEETIEESQENQLEQQPEIVPVYDTVSTTRFLTTIAREHYGNYNFWPYIYLENEKILGHPDRITPGTQVIVPDLSKYGVNPENKEDIETAKKKGLEIYARFKTR